MTKKFQFLKAERASIKGALRSRQSDAVDQFIACLESDLAEWRQDWPEVSAEDLRTVRHRLANMEKHLGWLLYEMRALPDNAWPPRLPRNTADLEGLLIAIQEEKARRRTGYDNHRKFDLARRAALSYCHVFKRKPARTPRSPFMECMATISSAAGLMVGKDIAGDGLDTGIEEYNWHLRYFGLRDL